MSFEAESYAFGSSVYGGRPTFALTRRIDDTPELTLYEFTPEEIAAARADRFERTGKRHHVTVETFDDVVVDGDAPTAEPATGPSAADWTWDGWCGIKIETLRGKQLKAARQPIRSALADANRNADTVLSGGAATTCLPEGVGVRLALAFLGLKDLRRYDKLDEFATGVTRMSVEECYYWHAKSRSPSSPNGVKSLRVLLTDHVN